MPAVSSILLVHVLQLLDNIDSSVFIKLFLFRSHAHAHVCSQPACLYTGSRQHVIGGQFCM